MEIDADRLDLTRPPKKHERCVSGQELLDRGVGASARGSIVVGECEVLRRVHRRIAVARPVVPFGRDLIAGELRRVVRVAAGVPGLHRNVELSVGLDAVAGRPVPRRRPGALGYGIDMMTTPRLRSVIESVR